MKTPLFFRNSRKTKSTTLLVLFFCLHLQTFAQGPFVWQNIFNRPGPSGYSQNVASTDIAYTENGSAIVGGTAPDSLGGSYGETDGCLLKYSPSGTLLNTYYYDYANTHGFDKVVKVITKGPYVYALIDGVYNATSAADHDIVLVKLDTSLNYIGATYYNGIGNVNDVPVDMGMDMYDNIYVLGNTSTVATGSDIILIKFNSSFATLFTKSFSSTGIATDVAKAMKVEPNGVCDITGSAYSTTLGNRLVVLKYWGNGISLWTRYHDANLSAASDDYGTALSYDGVTGDIYVTGRGFYGTNYDWVVAKFNGIDGTKAWSKRFSGVDNNDDWGIDISYFNSGALYVTGNFKSTVSSVNLPSIVLKKLLPSDGSSIWSKTYTGVATTSSTSSLGAYVSSLLVTPNENIYVIGTTGIQTPSYNEANHLVLKYTSAGVLSWSDLRSSGSVSGFQSFKGVKATYIPSSQTLYVAGTMSIGMSFYGSMTIMKYAPTSIVSSHLESRVNQFTSDLDLNLYPNPCVNTINLSSSNISELTSLEIVDLTGKVVFASDKLTLPISIPTDQLTTGLYHLIMNNNGTLVSKKFLKE